VDVNKVLLVHPPSGDANRLWAIEQALRSSACAAVVGWIELAREVALRRLQLMAEARRCWTVIFRPASSMQQSSPAALRLAILKEGSITRLRIIKNRGGCPAVIDLSFPQSVPDGDSASSLGDLKWQ
jgi:cell division inhibitor SulA/protein ImuA